jgi:hypothetical protein
MRKLARIFILSLAAAALAAPADAAAMGGGGAGGGGGAFFPQGGGPPVGGAGAGPGPGSHVSGGGLAPRSQAAPNGGFPQQGKPGVWVGGRPVGGAWRRHYPWPGGPVFVPNGGYFSYGGGYYYDETDVNNCWVYRKVYDRAGHFLGWAHIDLCEDQ